MPQRQNIHFGRATVPADENGGWALPGQRSTRCEDEARDEAVRLDRLIGAAPASPRKARMPAVVTRRKARDARYVQSRA